MSPWRLFVLKWNVNSEFAPFSPACKLLFSHLPHDEGVHTLQSSVAPRRLASGVGTSAEVHHGGKAPVSEAFAPQPPHISLQLGKYEIRLADTLAEREAACHLRFKVFNIELGEGLESSYQTGLDQDHFDLFCDHLIVEDRSKREVVGTYRMQSGITAGLKLGYYSEQEFDFSPYDGIRTEVLELGRASIDREHHDLRAGRGGRPTRCAPRLTRRSATAGNAHGGIDDRRRLTRRGSAGGTSFGRAAAVRLSRRRIPGELFSS